MSRATRSSSRVNLKEKENVAMNTIVKKKESKKRKSLNISSEDSSPAKSTRSRSRTPAQSTRSRSSSRCSSVVSSPGSASSKSQFKSRSNSRSSSSLSPLAGHFARNLKLSTPKSKPIVSKPKSVRRALVKNSDYRLPGREKEFDELTSYLKSIAEVNGSGSLYISGAPGKLF